MNTHPLAPIPDADVDAFWRDGVICLRGLFDAEWIEHMRAAVEDDLAHPGPLAREYATQQGQRFLGDIGAWAVKPMLRKYVEASPAAEIAARMLRSRKVNFLYDQLFVKEPGTSVPTPWHQDGPYWPVKGEQILSIWLALDDVTVESSGVEYIKGSHRWGREFRPIHFGGDTEAYKMLPGETLPDINALRQDPKNQLEIVNWDMRAGRQRQLHAPPPRLRDALDRGRRGLRAAHRTSLDHDRAADDPAGRADRLCSVSPVVAAARAQLNRATTSDAPRGQVHE